MSTMVVMVVLPLLGLLEGAGGSTAELDCGLLANSVEEVSGDDQDIVESSTYNGGDPGADGQRGGVQDRSLSRDGGGETDDGEGGVLHFGGRF